MFEKRYDIAIDSGIGFRDCKSEVVPFSAMSPHLNTAMYNQCTNNFSTTDRRVMQDVTVETKINYHARGCQRRCRRPKRPWKQCFKFDLADGVTDVDQNGFVASSPENSQNIHKIRRL